jgi:superfamily I DNA/RNA helicase
MGEFENMAGFLEHIALVMDRDSGDEDDKVNIMTLHSAKGLEFGTVFLPGWEEGLFPHQRSLDEKGKAGLEEERRLAYVGITRARQTLTFSFVERRKRGGEVIACEPSRFLKELPPDDLRWEEPDREPDPQAILGRAEVYLSNLRNMLGNS